MDGSYPGHAVCSILDSGIFGMTLMYPLTFFDLVRTGIGDIQSDRESGTVLRRATFTQLHCFRLS